MELKNYQEDVVLRAIEIALEETPELLDDERFVKDVAAYVLNRVPPRYVMSERGFLRLAVEHLEEAEQEKSLANVIELMMLVNRGVELVRERRSVEPECENHVQPTEGLDAPIGPEYVHNYPQFVGRVVDSVSREPVFDARVSMHIDGDLAPPGGRGWQNPYFTRKETGGHFSFWPRATRSEKRMLSGELLFTVDHPDYVPFRHVEILVTEGGFDAERTLYADKIVSLAAFALEKRVVLRKENS